MSSPICFRVDAEQKRRIEAAARLRGQSITSFVKGEIMRVVERTEKNPPAPGRFFGGVPSYFRALCQEATAGGTGGYKVPGYEFARHLTSTSPDAIELEEWGEEVERLEGILDQDAGAWEWFERFFPKCTALVPARRRGQFLEGIRDAFRDGIVS